MDCVCTFVKIFNKRLIFQLKKENESYKEKLNKYEPVSVISEEEFQVNNKATCSSYGRSYNSSNELQSTSYNEVTSLNNVAHSTLENQKCDEVSNNSVVTFDRVVSRVFLILLI